MEEIGFYGKQRITECLKKHGLRLKKRWGQNFLKDKNISDKIAQIALTNIRDYDTQLNSKVWEIGPGLGALTSALYRLSPNSNLELFEIDFGLIRILKQSIEITGVENIISIHAGNAEESLHQVINYIIRDSEINKIPDLIVGNLPYSSGMRILLSASKIQIRLNEAFGTRKAIPMCVMLQRETIERISAKLSTKMYGFTSVILQLLYDIRPVMDVPPHVFYPVPHVESVLCSLVPNNTSLDLSVKELEFINTIVHCAFTQRRKTLYNNLKALMSSLDLQNFESYCEKVGISSKFRAEHVEAVQYLKLARLILDAKNNI